MSKEHTLLRYGSKNLSLDICLEKGSASVRFGTNEPAWLYPRKQNETTILFGEADKILNEIANVWGPIVLQFDTANGNLKLWAKSRTYIFKFDEVAQDGVLGYRITVTKRYPKKSEYPIG